MFWFSLSWNWQVFLGASPLQFHGYHRGFPLLSLIRHLCMFCRKETDVCVVLLMLFQAMPHLGSSPVPQVCNNEPAQAEATVGLALLPFGVFLAEMPC